MGSGQSAEAPPNTAIKTPDPKPSTKKGKPRPTEGIALVEYICRKKKRAWNRCVGSFYGRFSSGKVLEDEQVDCDDLFEAYRECYMTQLLKERQRKGLAPPAEGTLLAEFAEEQED